MNFIIKDIRENIVVLARRIGYQILEAKSHNEYNLVRKLTRDNYPRFHLFVIQAGDNFHFNLHLDQKEPSYPGTHAHSGEYDGPPVQDEAERIINLLE